VPYSDEVVGVGSRVGGGGGGGRGAVMVRALENHIEHTGFESSPGE